MGVVRTIMGVPVTPIFGRARLQKMAGKETQDSLLLLESKEEGELSEALKRNLLLEVFICIPIYGVIYFLFLYIA